MPLMVHSTCRAPAWMAAIELATAMPRSLWQWADSVTSSPIRARTAVNIRVMSSGSA